VAWFVFKYLPICKIYANWLSAKAHFQGIGFTRLCIVTRLGQRVTTWPNNEKLTPIDEAATVRARIPRSSARPAQTKLKPLQCAPWKRGRAV